MLGIFLDTETNGLNPFTHKVLEIAFTLIDLSTGEVKKEFCEQIAPSLQEWEKSDLESLKINGFSWEDLRLGKSSSQVGILIEQLFADYHLKRGNAIFICQNPSFDRPFFSQLVSPVTQEKSLYPYHWLDLASMFWTQSLTKYKEKQGPAPWTIGCSKDQIAAFYQIPPEAKPHRAINGVNHLIQCYKAIVGFPNPLLQAHV